ncbi:MAG: heme-binding protein [Gammaproteobacteria bacterium]|nr:heme-binding protein [Gammaproteobacteria bacterium]MDH5650596.1 heme-binding protein [Gammaproteobacteria bacterium]
MPNQQVTTILFTLFIFLAGNVSAATQAEEKGIFINRNLTVDTASAAAWQALLDCRKKGYSVAVAVVDRGGNLQAFFRDRFAGPHTTETAVRKAWTAVSFRQSTAELAVFLQKGRIPNQVQHNPGALLVGGGLVIQSQGEIIGGIGVSGAPPGKSEQDSIDGACAGAGIKAIQEVLEFD